MSKNKIKDEFEEKYYDIGNDSLDDDNLIDNNRFSNKSDAPIAEEEDDFVDVRGTVKSAAPLEKIDEEEEYEFNVSNKTIDKDVIIDDYFDKQSKQGSESSDQTDNNTNSDNNNNDSTNNSTQTVFEKPKGAIEPNLEKSQQEVIENKEKEFVDENVDEVVAEDQQKEKDVVNTPTTNPPTNETQKDNNTPTIETNNVVQHVPFQDENNYPALEDIETNDLDVSKNNLGKGQIDKDKVNLEKAEKQFKYSAGVFAAVTGLKQDDEQVEMYNQLFKNANGLPSEIRSDYIKDTYKNMFKDGLLNALKAIQNKTNNGEATSSLDNLLAQADQFMQALMDYLKAQNPELKNFNPPKFGGMHPDELKDSILDTYNGIRRENQNRQDKNKVLGTINNYKAQVTKDAVEGFNNFCSNLNSAEGLSFNGQKLQEYLQNRWKDSTADSLDAQRANFNKELSNMMKQSYQTMLNNSNHKTDMQVQLDNFDKFSKQVENLCKAKGWMDKNEEHKMFGGLNPETIKSMQQTSLLSKPQNMEEWANDKVDEITGTKEFKKTQKALETAKNAKTKDKNKIKELEKSLEGQKKNTTTKQQKDNVVNYINNVLKGIPNADKRGLDNPEARNAINIARAFEMKNAGRSLGWKMANPRLNKLYKDVVFNITKDLTEKGYNKEVIDYMLHNPVDPKNDEIAQGREKQLNGLDNLKTRNENLIKAKDNVNDMTKIKEDGEPITVPEAKDIEDPNVEKSKFISAPQVEKKLEVGMTTEKK